jgi:ribosomal protein L37AE/L43A
MDEESKLARNPTIIPEREKRTTGCPNCGANDYDGSSHGGVVVRKCRQCKTEWQGGLPQEPLDPKVPYPVDNYTAPVTFDRSLLKNAGASPGLPEGVVEHTRPVDTRPEFRKGLPISDDEEL